MNILNNIPENAKLIGVGEEGINTVFNLEGELKENMLFEKIAINQNVDKDYVRNLLDGVDILFITYSHEDTRAREIAKAIGFMANERRILCIGLDLSQKENKDEINMDRELKINKYNTDTIVSLINMIIESISDDCMINIDLTDIKEAICGDKGIKYVYGEFEKNISIEEITNNLVESINIVGEEFTGKKGILFVDMAQNYCEDNNMLIVLNELLTEVQKQSDTSYEIIFSLHIKEREDAKIRVGLILN